MSDDLTDRLPGGPNEPSTRDLVLQVLERVTGLGENVTELGERVASLDGRVTSLDGRMSRVETALGIGEADTQPLSGRVNRLIAEFAEFKAETGERLDDVERELARLSRQDAGRYLRLEERVRALERPHERTE